MSFYKKCQLQICNKWGNSERMNGVEGDQLTIYTDIYMKGIISDYRLASLTWDGEVYTVGEGA